MVAKESYPTASGSPRKTFIVIVFVFLLLAICCTGIYALAVRARAAACQLTDSLNLKAIHLSMYVYATKNENLYPPHVGVLIPEYALEAEIFTRFGNSAPAYDGKLPEAVLYRFGDYFFVHQGLEIESDPDYVLAFSVPDPTAKVTVMFGDGHTESITLDELREAISFSNQLRRQEDPPLAPILLSNILDPSPNG